MGYTNAGRAPRRLLQTHGAFINCVLSPGIRMRRRHGYGSGKPLGLDDTAATTDVAQRNKNKRLNEMYKFTSNDECFDCRAGEILVSSNNESGFPSHRRAAVFSSLNGFKVASAGTARQVDPEDALLDSDIKFVGLCQNDFVSSDTALQDQGMVCQMSGIKTVINESESTIYVGDRLRMAPLMEPPTIGRKGIPLEKTRLILKRVDDNWLPKKAIERAKKNMRGTNAAIPIPTTPAAFDKFVNDYAAELIKEWRKCARTVVGVAGNNARHGEQLDVCLQQPNIV